jgi:hypothetical protein
MYLYEQLLVFAASQETKDITRPVLDHQHAVPTADYDVVHASRRFQKICELLFFDSQLLKSLS